MKSYARLITLAFLFLLSVSCAPRGDVWVRLENRASFVMHTPTIANEVFMYDKDKNEIDAIDLLAVEQEEIAYLKFSESEIVSAYNNEYPLVFRVISAEYDTRYETAAWYDIGGNGGNEIVIIITDATDLDVLNQTAL